MSALLELEDVSRRFGGISALDKVSLRLEAGEVVGLIGPNGAGKTTLVNVITGVHRPSTGIIRFRGQRIDRLRPDRIARQGIARTFQIMQPFAKFTVLDNVAAAALFAVGTPSLAAAREEARESLAFVGLDHIADAPAYSLPLAYRKRLELAKSLAMRPQLLLLDEVNAGLNATELDGALALIDQIAARGITILLIEHLMKVVLRASHRVVVLHHGVVIADDKPSAVMQDSAVIEAYLGKRFAAQRSGAPS